MSDINPNYLQYASAEALSSHEVACLLMGIDPLCAKTPGVVPVCPSDVRNLIDLDEWSKDYHLYEKTITSGIEYGKLAAISSNKCSPKAALCYLLKKEHDHNWGSQLELNPFFLAVDPEKPDQITELEALVSILEDDVTRLEKRFKYITPRLQWIYRVIDEWYSTPDEPFPTKTVLETWIRDTAKKEGATISDNDVKLILGVVRSEDQKKGGRPSRKDE